MVNKLALMGRWGWAASRAVDYLVTLPEVDKEKIGLTGHSRNGKQALVAAAFDERIGAVGDFLNQEDGRPINSAAQWEEKKKSIRQAISRVLGEAPNRVPFPAHRELSEPKLATDGWLATLYRRPAKDSWGDYGDRYQWERLEREGIGAMGVPFGDSVMGDLFYPLGPDGKPKPGKWPVVVWLHPYCYQNGWSAAAPWLLTGDA